MEFENYTDGKERSDVDKIMELERLYGLNVLSPFGTSNKEVFEEKLKNMDLTEMARLAEQLGTIRAADIEQQKVFLRESFRDWQRKNGDPIGDKVKGERPNSTEVKGGQAIQQMLDRDRRLDTFEKIFPDVDTEEVFLDKIREYTLFDLRNLAARLGYNPSFDRSRLILLLKKEFSTDLIKRSRV